MSLFSILNTTSRAVRAGRKVANASNIGQAVGAVSNFLPDSLRNDASNALGRAGELRNRFDLGPRVPQNTNSQFDISKFTSEITKNGYGQNNRFHAVVFPPAAISGSNTAEQLRLRCFAASLPGQTLMSYDIRRYGMGQIEHMPHNSQYNQISLSFLVDSNGDVPRLFARWLKYIQAADDGSGSATPENSYLVNYKENYAGPLTISQVSSMNNHLYGVNLRNAFPISIGDQQLAWDSNNSISVLPVTFAFTDFISW